LIEPASNVSVPFNVVMRTLSSVDDNVIVPLPNDEIAPECPMFVDIQILPLIFTRVIT